MCKDDPATAAAMRNATNTHDGTRPITMNHIVTAQGALPYLDVQGMSHRTGAVSSLSLSLSVSLSLSL